MRFSFFEIISIALLKEVGRKKGKIKMKFLLCLCLLFAGSVCQKIDFEVKYPKSNQILFRERGTIINKATFLHVKFFMNMSLILEELEHVIQRLNETFLMESKRSIEPIPSFLLGSEMVGKESLWKASEIEALYSTRSKDGVVITGLLLQMFERNYNELKDALNVMPKESDYASNGHRQKRLILGELFGGAALAIGVRNVGKISVIEKSLHNFTRKYNKLIDSTQLLADKHEQLVLDSAILKQLILMLEGRNYHKIMALVTVLNDRLTKLISNVHSVITSGQQHHVSTELISGEALIQLFNSISFKAQEMGCEMVLEDPSDFYDLESTYGYDKEGKEFAIYVHVPLVTKNERLRLLEYIPYPILQSLSLNATILPQTRKENLIALLPEQVSQKESVVPQHKFRILEELELENCHRIKTTYLCSGRNTLRTDIENSCIGSLWLREHSLITKNCDVRVTESTEFVARLSNNKWLVFSPLPFSTNIICGKSEHENLRLEVQTEIRLPEDCKVQLKRHVLTTDVNVFFGFAIKNYDWQFDGNIFDGLINNQEQLKEIFQTLLTSRTELRIKDLEGLKHYFEISQSYYSELWNMLKNLSFIPWFDGLTLTLLICAFGVLIFFFLYKSGYCCCCRKAVTFNQTVADIAADIASSLPPPYDSIIRPSAPEGTPYPSRRPSFAIVTERVSPTAARVSHSAGTLNRQECRHRNFECLEHVEDGYCLGTISQ